LNSQATRLSRSFETRGFPSPLHNGFGFIGYAVDSI
jgi:hypothetical protein